MNDGADRHHAEARLILCFFVVELRLRLGAGLSGRFEGRIVNGRAGCAARARGGGEPEDCDPSEAGAKRDRRPERDRKDATRDRQNGVADDPAEAGGERPASRRGKQGSQTRRRHNSDQTEPGFQARPLKPPPSEEAPAPECGRGQQGCRREADELHHDVGGDRARRAEKIMDTRVGRVIEARIADRPSQQGEAEAGYAGKRD